MIKIVEGYAHRQARKDGSVESFKSTFAQVLLGGEAGGMDGMITLLSAASSVMDSVANMDLAVNIEPSSTSRRPMMAPSGLDATFNASPIDGRGHASDAMARAGSLAPSAGDSETSRGPTLPKDDTLVDLVGTLHQLNQFFAEGGPGETSAAPELGPGPGLQFLNGRMHTIRPAQASLTGGLLILFSSNSQSKNASTFAYTVPQHILFVE